MTSQTDERWTILRMLNWTTDYLLKQGAEDRKSARLDAEVLLAAARKCERIQLYTSFNEEPSEEVRTAFRELIRRRASGVPVAYLVGTKEFYSLDFEVNDQVLIPRPDTEHVVIGLLDLIKEDYPQGAVTACDIGTGSGCIAVAAARHCPRLQVLALDHSPDALRVAARNARRHGVAERVELLESDVLAAVPRERRFHFIVSNPPYLRTDELPMLAADVREHEPRTALEAGPRGTEIYEQIIPQAAEHLYAGGCLLLEIGYTQDQAVRDLITADGRYELLPTIKDLGGHARVVRARRR